MKLKMYRYILFVLAISGCGFALPALVPNGIHDSLTELAKNCGNRIIAAEVTKQSGGCNLTAPPYNERQVQCLLFYDVNKQLCSASAKINLEQDDFSKKININIKTLDLCSMAKNWVLHELDDYPLYYSKMSGLFRNDLYCGKICNEPDVLSENSNFYCNYYQWGTQLLQSLTPTAQPQANDINNTKTDTAPVDMSSPTQLETGISAGEKATDETVKPSINVHSKATEEATKENATKSVDHPIPKNVAVTTGAGSNPENADISPVAPEDVSKLQENKLDEMDIKIDKPVIQDPKVPVNPDENKDVPLGEGEDEDYPDMDGAKEEFPEPNINVNSDTGAAKPEVKEENKPKYSKAPMSSFDTELEPKVPAMAYGDDNFQNSDDNFFPFFLSMVVSIVLVYVLYHNKSRLTKMFLGLIVEGRQQSRRRNSRGHFYRRLDTLEQAMASNTAAAPSKIIY